MKKLLYCGVVATAMLLVHATDSIYVDGVQTAGGGGGGSGDAGAVAVAATNYTDVVASNTLATASNNTDRVGAAVAAAGTNYTDSVMAMASNTVFVAKHGSDSNTGLNWNKAKLTIQAGVDAAAAVFAATGFRQEVWVSAGSYNGSVTVSNGVSMVGTARDTCHLNGSVTVPATYTGGAPISRMGIVATGTVGRQLTVENGASGNIRIQNMGFICTALTSFTDVPIVIAGGNVIFDNVGLSAANADFTGMGTASGNWITITNSASFTAYGMQMLIDNMVNPAVTIAMIKDWSAGETVIQNSIVDLALAAATTAHVSFYEGLVRGTGKRIARNHVRIKGVGGTGEGEGFVTRGDTLIRFSGNDIQVEGFEANYSYEAYDTSEMDINGADDIAVEGTKAAATATIKYTGAPADRIFQLDGLRFGRDGTVYTEIPSFDIGAGHNGVSWASFGTAAEVVVGTNPLYINILSAANDYPITFVDEEGRATGLSGTISGWASVRSRNGVATAGIFTKSPAVTGLIETLAGRTGTVTVTGLRIGQTYTVDLIANAATFHGAISTCNYAISGVATQLNVDISGTPPATATSGITLTNLVAASTTMEIKAWSTDPTKAAAISAFRITGPLSSGFLHKDGTDPMTGALDMGGYSITNAGHITPVSSNAFDLGTPGKPWRDLHLGGDSIYMGGTKVMSYTNDTIVMSAPIVEQHGTNPVVGYVPYAGATRSVDLGTNSLNVGDVVVNGGAQTNNACLYFNGFSPAATAYIDTGKAHLSGNTAFTYSFWLKPTIAQRGPAIINQYNGAGVSIFLTTASPATDQRVGITFNGELIPTDNSRNLTTNLWWHVVITYDGTNLKWFRNTVQERMYDSREGGWFYTYNPTSDANFPAVNTLIGGATSGGSFEGYIEQPLIFNRALSSGEIGLLYAAGAGLAVNTAIAPFNSGLVAAYPLKEGSGTTINNIVDDLSATIYSGTTITWVDDSPIDKVSILTDTISLASYSRVSYNSDDGLVIDTTGGNSKAKIKGVLSITGALTASNLSGSNTGDQNLTGLVPYTGSTTRVNLGTNTLTAGSVAVSNTLITSQWVYMGGATNAAGCWRFGVDPVTTNMMFQSFNGTLWVTNSIIER